MLRRLLVVVLTACTLVAVGTVPASAARFADVPDSHTFADEIAWLSQAGITGGYADGTFQPSAPVLREQMAVFLWRAAGEPRVSNLPSTSPFRDVPTSHAFYEAIVWLSRSGISTGYADGSFQPSAPVLREQMAAFLHRFRALTATPGTTGPTFSDVPATHVFAGQIRWLAQSGISTGYSDGTFRPSAPVLREQMAAFLSRYDDRFDLPGVAPGNFTSQPTPQITGAPRVGSPLRGVPGLWTPSPASVAYQWLRNGSVISGATGLTYTPVAADQGATLTFRATAQRPGATTSVRTSAPTAAVAPAVAVEIQRILDDTNAFRARYGRAPLTLDPQISSVAQNWTNYMASSCTFDHNPSFSTQMRAGWTAAAENIAAGQQYTDVVAAWINSPGHRANLLGDYTHIGIGYVGASSCPYGRYYTQNFGRY
jgi:uncharacterized protein YkwD